MCTGPGRAEAQTTAVRPAQPPLLDVASAVPGDTRPPPRQVLTPWVTPHTEADLNPLLELPWPRQITFKIRL